MRDKPKLGPVAMCVLVTPDGQAQVDAYTRFLHQRVSQRGALDSASAEALGFPDLAGHATWVLANSAGREWLQFVEYARATPKNSLGTYGWLAMEVLVQDIDTLAAGLAHSPFELLREVADLDVSDKIRACQVRGPAGEILYLTQVKGEVPPFDLPACVAPVDHLFIPVLSTSSRERSLAEYSAISGSDGMSFETKITVINQARNFELDRRHPVATLQLAGQALIEIDQIEGTEEPPPGITGGMACVVLHCEARPPATATEHKSGPFAGHRTSSHRGWAGEHFTLLYS